MARSRSCHIREGLEAATPDGRLALPLARPIMALVALFAFVSDWTPCPAGAGHRDACRGHKGMTARGAGRNYAVRLLLCGATGGEDLAHAVRAEIGEAATLRLLVANQPTRH